MEVLTSLPAGWLLLFVLGGVLVFSGLMIVVLQRTVRTDGRERAGLVAAAYMTALGSLFAILTGFLLNGEYAVLRDTQRLVYEEVAAGSRVAFSAEGLPAADVSVVQDRLVNYFGSLPGSEWRALSRDAPDESASVGALSDLQRVVFAIGSRPYAPRSSVDGMQAAVGEITGIRRERASVASQSTPVALVVLSVFTGLALIVNAIIVALRSGVGFAVFAVGIIVIVALDLGAVIGISAPFNGPFQVDPAPAAELARDIQRGEYLSWVKVR